MIDIIENKFKITFKYDATLVAEIKTIKSARWNPSTKFWSVPVSSWEEIEELGWEMSQEAKQLIQKEKEKKEKNLSLSNSKESYLEIEGLARDLLPFQKVAIEFVKNNSGKSLIADQMGLGKTIEAIASIHYLQAFPSLIVCPASLKINWKREIEKWLPGNVVTVANGTIEMVCLTDFLIINYDILEKNIEILKSVKWGSIVFDESHYLKNKKAKRTKSALELAKEIPVRLCLTGTPVMNRPLELVTQLEILDKIQNFGGSWNFLQRYCGAYKSKWGWNFTGATYLDELNEKLRSSCMVRRLKSEVLSELPEKRQQVIEVEIDNRKEYDYAEQEFGEWLIENVDIEKAESIINTQAMRLVKIEKLKQLVAKGKIQSICSIIDEYIEANEKLVIFANHVEIQRELIEKYNCCYLLGEDNSEKRQINIDRFQNDINEKLIICSLKAGGVGITLHSASNVMFVELGWTPAEHEQAEDRLHRIGQKDSVTALYVLGQNTVEQEIWNLIQKKREIVNKVTGDSSFVSSQQIDIVDEITKKLLEKYKNKRR